MVMKIGLLDCKSGGVQFLAQLSGCAYMITSRKPYTASLEIWMIGLWTVGPIDYNLIQMDDSCATSPLAFLLVF